MAKNDDVHVEHNLNPEGAQQLLRDYTAADNVTPAQRIPLNIDPRSRGILPAAATDEDVAEYNKNRTAAKSRNRTVGTKSDKGLK